MKRILNYPIVLLALGLVVYLPLINSYFVHDEWHLLLTFYYHKQFPVLQTLVGFFAPQPGQYVPLVHVLCYLIFHFFGPSYTVFFVIGMIFHWLVSLLLYYLLNFLSGNKTMSLAISFLFLIAPHAFQANSWVMTNLGYSGASIFIVFGLLLFFKWLKKENKKLLFWSVMSFCVSMLFKTLAIYLVIALPLIVLVWTRKISKIKTIGLFLIPLVVMIIINYYIVHTFPQSDFTVTSSPGPFHIFTLAMRSLSGSLLPESTIYFLSKIILFIIPPINFDKLQTTAFNQQVEGIGAAIITFLAMCAVLFFSKRILKLSYRYYLIFIAGIILAAISGLTYYFVDTPQFSLLPPRYLYVGLFGSALMLLSLLQILKKQRSLQLVVVLTLLFFLSTWGMSENMSIVNRRRYLIIDKISQHIPKSDKLILYIESDKSYYGLPETIKTLPLQVGAGKIFAVYLHERLSLPKKVYEYEVFKGMDSQGYYEDTSGGYGFFREFDDLRMSIKPQDINYVYAFKYSSADDSIDNITQQTRLKLSTN